MFVAPDLTCTSAILDIARQGNVYCPASDYVGCYSPRQPCVQQDRRALTYYGAARGLLKKIARVPPAQWCTKDAIMLWLYSKRIVCHENKVLDILAHVAYTHRTNARDKRRVHHSVVALDIKAASCASVGTRCGKEES